jgi:hypothetical protein
MKFNLNSFKRRNFLKKTFFIFSIIFVKKNFLNFFLISKNILRKFDKKNNVVWILKNND